MIEGGEVTSKRGVVAANPVEAARIGARVIENGGNAFDAAVAASMACCMLRPNQTGVGGYVCSAVVREAKTGKVWSIDANGVAPAAAHERMYEVLPAGDGKADGWLNELEYFCSVKDHANVYGPLAVTAPGMMAGMGTIHERWGRLPWASVVEPSIALIERGIPYEEVAGAIANLQHVITRYPATMNHLMPEGRAPKPTDTWHRVDMEKTLRRVASEGWRDFYEGELGQTIADHIQSLGGILTRKDMAEYRPRVTEPYTTRYRNATASTPILPNGGITCLQALNMIECLSLPREDTPEYWHVLAEVMKLAWRDRINHLGDPAFCDVPIDRLLSKGYAAGRVETIDRFPAHVDRLVPPPDHDAPNGTLHVSAADAQGNVVAMTISQGSTFGSCVCVPGTGVILGHGMCRLDPRPGRANSVAPGKRPLNNTAAMLVEMPDRFVGVGLPGGRKIITVMARAAQLLVDRGCSAREVAIAERMHIEMNEPVRFRTTMPAGTIDAVKAMGHDVVLDQVICGVMNCAEHLRSSATTRAGSEAIVAGAE